MPFLITGGGPSRSKVLCRDGAQLFLRLTKPISQEDIVATHSFLMCSGPTEKTYSTFEGGGYMCPEAAMIMARVSPAASETACV